MLSPFNKFKNLKSKLNETKESLVKRGAYLRPGTYRMTLTGKPVVYLPTEETNQFIQKNLQHMSRQSKELSLPFTHKVKEKLTRLLRFKIIDEASGTGTLVMFSRDNDMKVFDFSKEIVTTFLEDEAEYALIKKNFEQFQAYFPMTMNRYLDEELAYEEKYLDFIPYRDWKTEERRQCIERLTAYYESYIETEQETTYQSMEELLTTFKEKVHNEELIKEVEGLLVGQEDLSHLNFKVLAQHGDLNFNNILLYDEQYYIIDWEDVGEYLFYYDLLNCLFVEAAFSDDFSYINAYIAGELDELFTAIFKAAHMSYDPKQKKVYLAAYICMRMTEFELDVHASIIDNIYEKYLNVLRSL